MRWCARCRDPELRAAHGLRPPLALPEALVAALARERAGADDGSAPGTEIDVRAPSEAAPGATPFLHRFDPTRQGVPTLPEFGGIRVYPDALSPAEARALLARIDAGAFQPSQSGKQKQHFGPRVNFLRRRMNADRFEGLPDWAAPLEQRLRQRVADDRAGDPADLARCRAALAAFETTDVFVLRYRAEEQSNLDFHVDDLFAYGEAILDVSLGSDSVLTLLGPFEDDGRGASATPCAFAAPSGGLRCVRVPLPERSLAVLYGPARLAWQHAILPIDVRGVRTSVTLRTLAPALRATEPGRTVLARIHRAAAPDGAFDVAPATRCQTAAHPAD